VVDKLRIAEKLDAFGIITLKAAGRVQSKDIEFFASQAQEVQAGSLAAFGSTRRRVSRLRATTRSGYYSSANPV